jgi:hypothetical protein
MAAQFGHRCSPVANAPEPIDDGRTTFRSRRTSTAGGPLIAAAALQLSLSSPTLLIMEAIERFDGIHARHNPFLLTTLSPW